MVNDREALLGAASRHLWAPVFNKDLCHIGCRAMSYLLQVFIMAAVMGCAVSPMIGQCCDCVVQTGVFVKGGLTWLPTGCKGKYTVWASWFI